jgi:hypothetical protein
MGNTYLSSDESLILSTHNIRIAGVVLDLMLTSRRLILIDNSVTPFHLRTIPLDSIITAVSGTDVKGDPIITLSHMDPSRAGAPQPIDFIFIQQKGEQRATECSEWAATLRNHAAEARSGALSAGTLPYDPVKSIQPRMSATYRIETFSPRKPVMEEYPVKTEPVIAPEPEVLGDDGISAVTNEPVKPSGELVFSPSGEEEPVPHGIEISGAGNYLNSFPAPEELGEVSDPSVPNDESFDTHDPDTEQPPVIPIDDVANGTTPDVIPELEKLISLPPEVMPENDETPEISDAQEPVEPEPHEIGISGARKFLNSLSAPEELREVPDSSAPPSESFDMIAPNTEQPPVIPIDDVANGTTPDVIPEPEKPISLQPEVSPENDETPELSDAARIWAEAAHSATPLPLPVPTIPVPETFSVPNPRVDESIVATVPPKDGIEKPVVEIKKEPETTDAIIPEYFRKTGRMGEPEPEIRQVPLVSPSSYLPALPMKSSHSFFIAVILIILVGLFGAFLGVYFLYGTHGTSQPAVVPVITVQTPVNVPTIVPADGVWVRIEYPGTFIGEVGNPGLMHPVSGTGVQLYKVLWSDHVVKASAQKQDNSGDTLVIEVYNAGYLIKRSSTRAPMGDVVILIDPTTGRPPGIKDGEIP